MNKLYVDLRKFKVSNYSTLVIAASLAVALLTSIYVLLHSPYKELHEQIFLTAENVRKYYSDRPGYWKLATQSAKDDRLVTEKLLKSEYKFEIGSGENGDMAMPADTTFDITLKNLNKSACIGLTEAKINKNQQLALQRITIINAKGTTEFIWGAKHSLPVGKYATRNICQPTGNTVMWTFQ